MCLPDRVDGSWSSSLDSLRSLVGPFKLLTSDDGSGGGGDDDDNNDNGRDDSVGT